MYTHSKGEDMNRGQKRDLFIIRLEMIQQRHELSDAQFAALLKRKRQMWEAWRNGRAAKTGMKLKTCYELIENLNEGLTKLLEVEWNNKFSAIINENEAEFKKSVLI